MKRKKERAEISTNVDDFSFHSSVSNLYEVDFSFGTITLAYLIKCNSRV